MYTTIIDVPTLQANLGRPDWLVIDCRFSLADTAAGERAYAAAHIPGAVYAHLDRDLSSEPVTDSGRHPLPAPDAINAALQRLGVNPDSQVIVYDDAGGMVAGRLWWMLGYMGHEAVAVLSGGWQGWLAAGGETRNGVESVPAGTFNGTPDPSRFIQMDEVPQAKLLIDSRAMPRYLGEMEHLDPIAGHIPGARNFHFERNLADKYFRPAAELREQFIALLGDTDPADAVFYCGSGVSACVNLVALKYAGLGDAKLYVGSWSEWSRAGDQPIATGPE